MFCDLSDIGFIKIQGNDAKKFLQGQLTCDVEAITERHSSMGAHCNPQGRVVSLFHIFLFQDAYYLLMQREIIPGAIVNLKKYAVFFKLDIADVSDVWYAMGVKNINLETVNMHNLICISVENDRYIIASQIPSIKSFLQQQTENISLNDWKCLNIEDLIPALYAATSSKFLPHEINLHLLNAIGLAKGCYTGQEIIARMHYKGKLKNHMYFASIPDTFLPEAGMDIYSLQDKAFKPAGMIVDVAHAIHNHAYSMLVIANDAEQDLYLMQDENSVLMVKRK